MELYIQDKHQLRELEEMGIHYSGTPLFQTEWPNEAVTIPYYGDPEDLGAQFVFTLMPAATFNAILAESASAPLYRSMFVREVPGDVQAADGTVSYEALAQISDFAGTHTELVDGELVAPDRIDDPREKGLGRWIRKAVRKIVSTTRAAVDGVRKGIGAVAKVVNEETTLHMTFVASNRSAGFSGDMLQAWGNGFGNALVLSNTRVNVRQLRGWGLFNRYTNDVGNVDISVLKDKEARVCLEMDSNAAKFEKGNFMPVETCSKPFKPRGKKMRQRYEVKSEDVASLAQFIDSRNYASQVLGYTPPKAAVQTGWIAERFSSGGRPFVPCLASTNAPSTVVDAIAAGLNAGGIAAGSLVGLPIPVGTLVEMAMATDIMMPEGVDGRATPSHEYGHYFLCNLLAKENPHAYNTIWGQVTAAAFVDADDSEIRAVNEGFADFFAAQVSGGTAYYLDDGFGNRSSDDFFFDVSASSVGRGLEANVGAPLCAGPGALLPPACQVPTMLPVLTRNVGSVATLLHDIIDRSGCVNGCANTISDVSVYGAGFTLQRGTPVAIDDEEIQADPTRITAIFKRLAHGQVIAQGLSRENLHGYISEELSDYAPEQVCDLLALHSTVVSRCSAPVGVPPMTLVPVTPPTPVPVTPAPVTPPPVASPPSHTVSASTDGVGVAELSIGGQPCPASGCTVADGGTATVSVMLTPSTFLPRLLGWSGCQVSNQRFEVLLQGASSGYRYTADLVNVTSDLHCLANIGEGSLFLTYVEEPAKGTVDVSLSGPGDCARDQPIVGQNYCIIAPGVSGTASAVPAPGVSFQRFDCGDEPDHTSNPHVSAPIAGAAGLVCIARFAP